MSFKFEYEKPKVIAEIGCNHMGNLDIAFELIEMAQQCGATVAKFQKRDNKLLLTEEQYNAPHPNQYNSYGSTYGEHREFLEFTQQQHRQLKEHCDKIGIEYSTSVWEVNSAKQIAELNPSFIKVPSACNNNFELLKVLRDDYDGEVQISFGMTTHAEERAVINFFEETNQAKDRLIIYACTSGYPVPFENVALLEINRLYDAYGDRVKEIGFSGHHLGIAVDIAAYTLGAKWIERHFTKDRTWKGTDHAASLEREGLRRLVRDLNATHQSLAFKEQEILEIESVQRQKLKNRK
ncbi:MAG TPA: N-acetylneuraminate synthase family protein [Burkholderiales bacterium]|jgi:N-acetylneuraminate synthase|nr:N-acetylneuraminate synthase family protein [Burkholderiales bacterium]